MQLNADSISIIDNTKRAFEESFKANLVNDCFRNIVTRSIPLKVGEKEKIDDPNFRDKFSALLSGVSENFVKEFQNVGQFDTGNLFTSMVTSVADSVSLESDYRQQKLVNNILLGRIDQNNKMALRKACESAFANTHEFESDNIRRRYIQDLKYIMSVEGASDVIERIKNDVKDAIDETTAKNELVEGTTQEILDYKNEVAPPDDQYIDPNDPSTQPDAMGGDPNAMDGGVQDADPTAAINDVGDDGMAAAGDPNAMGGDQGMVDGEPATDGQQIYESEVGGLDPSAAGMGGSDGMGSDATSTGDDDPNSPGAEQLAGGQPPAPPAGGDMGGGVPGADTGGAGGDPSGMGGDQSGMAGDMSALNADPAGGGDPGTMGADDPAAGAGMDDPAGGDDQLAGVDTSDPNAMGGDPNAAGADPNAMGDPAAASPAPDAGAPSVQDGASNHNSGGITININGADLKKAKESMNIYNAYQLATKRIPIHPAAFNNMQTPSEGVLTAECVNAMGAGDLHKEMSMRLDGLKLAIKQSTNISKESQNALYDMANNYGKTLGNAITNAEIYTKKLNNLGLTPNGLIRSNEHTICIAKNIIDRFLTKRKFVAIEPHPYNSMENAIANAFDIVQLRQHLNHQKEPDTAMVNDLMSRESLFYHNMINFNDDTVKREATEIIDLSNLNFQKAMTPNFITDYRIKVWEENVGENANKNTNAEVIKRVKERFKQLWCRDLNEDELAIVKATTNQDDVTEIVPTPYEKFLVSMSRESILAHGSEDPSKGVSLSTAEKRDIEWKSRLMTTVYKSCEALGIIQPGDKVAFDKFTNMMGL